MPQREVQSAGSDSAVSRRAATHSNVAAWRAALPPLLLLLVLIVALYRDTAMAMVTIWYRSETFTHGFVVLPISLWLIWRRRPFLTVLQPRPGSYLLFLVVIGFALMWLLGDLVAVNSITQLAFVAMIVVSVPVVLGVPVAATIAFPLAFLFFAVPIGEFIMPQLMDWTAEFTILALRLSGIPVFREGLNFVIPSGNWSVVEACSGVRYLIASLTVGTLYAYLNYQSMRRRLLFILVSILVPIVANWLRAYMIVMLGHYSGNTIAVGVDHLIYGWVFFGVVVFLMFMIGARWAEPDSVVAVPAQVSSSAGKVPSVGSFWLTAIVFAVIVSTPIFVKSALESTAEGDAPRLELADAAVPAWTVGEPGTIGFAPNFENPSAKLNRVYNNGSQSVGVFVGYYRNQSYERKLVTSTNVLVRSEDKAWSQVNHGTVPVAIGGGTESVHFAELRRLSATTSVAPEKLLVWQIYWIHGRLTSNDYLAKAYSALYQLLGRGDDSAVLIFYTPLKDGVDAQATLAAFVSSGYGALDKALTEAAQDGHR